ncbi:MAG: hypothetical protein JWO36_37 [Myxococcales bacterium]|nr:hypothetical protein [Myxococcales bacterium]
MRIAFIIVTFLSLAACTKQNPNVCCTSTADCAAQGLPDITGCGGGLVCRGNQCIAETCAASTDCDAAAKYCINQSCAEMCTDDAQCPGFGQPATDQFCVAGACVACRATSDCPASASVCDMGTCRGCTSHADCASDLCDLDTGACVAETTIAYVTTGGSTTSGCTKSDPCQIQRAFAVIDSTRNAIKLGPGTHTYLGTDPTVFSPLILSGSKTATLFGPASLEASLSVSDGATLRARDITLTDSDPMNRDMRLLCRPVAIGGPMSYVDFARVETNDFPLGGAPCVMKVQRSRLHAVYNAAFDLLAVDGEVAGMLGATINRGSILTVDQTEFNGGYAGMDLQHYSSLQATNSVFRNQGMHGAIFVGINVATSSVQFSTFHNTFWGCPNGTPVFSSKDNLFLNEIAGAPANTVYGTQCVHTYDLVKPQTATPAGSNNTLGMDPRFKDALTGDFHLLAGSPAIDTADPAASETIDFDGTSRPQGAHRDVGAFEYKP